MQHTAAITGHGARHGIRRSSTRTLSLTEAIILAAIVAALAIASYFVRPSLPNDMATFEYRVESGDTLWDLAESHPVPGLTTEQTVSLIAEANGLDGGSILIAGASIHLPTQSTPEEGVALR